MGSHTTVDRDELGEPVSDRYRRLGAADDTPGMFVRFQPGFGLNVHIGTRYKRFRHDPLFPTAPWIEKELGVMSIDGWDALCVLVDEWRARQEATDADT